MPVEEVLDPPFCLFSLFYSSFNSYFKLGQFFFEVGCVLSMCQTHQMEQFPKMLDFCHVSM